MSPPNLLLIESLAGKESARSSTLLSASPCSQLTNGAVRSKSDVTEPGSELTEKEAMGSGGRSSLSRASAPRRLFSDSFMDSMEWSSTDGRAPKNTQQLQRFHVGKIVTCDMDSRRIDVPTAGQTPIQRVCVTHRSVFCELRIWRDTESSDLARSKHHSVSRTFEVLGGSVPCQSSR